MVSKLLIANGRGAAVVVWPDPYLDLYGFTAFDNVTWANNYGVSEDALFVLRKSAVQVGSCWAGAGAAACFGLLDHGWWRSLPDCAVRCCAAALQLCF